MKQEPSARTGPVARRRAGRGPGAVIALMVLAASVLCAPLLSAPSSPVVGPSLPWPVLVALWVPFELVFLHLQCGDDPDNANTFVLTELPLALGLLVCAPVALIAVAVATPVLVELVRRDKPAAKQLFNGVNKAVEVGVALTLYRSVTPADPLSLPGWVALCVAVGASSLTSSALVSLVIRLVSPQVPRREVVLHAVIPLPMAVVGATMAFCGVLALQAGPALAVPLGVSLVALLLLLRSLSVMTERHVSLIRLHALGQRLASAPDVPSVLHAAIDASTELLCSREATVYLPLSSDGDLVRVTEGASGQPHLLPVRVADVPRVRGTARRRTRVVAAAPLRARQEVVLAVAGRQAPVRPFRREDVRILEMVAHQTAQALHTAHLIDRLRRDALHDPLTDLPNRRSVVASLDERLAGRETLLVVCLGLLDVERVNAALGHDHGDRLLVEVARRLRAEIDPTAVLARVGDDSFAVLLPGGSSEGSVEQSVSAVLAALGRPVSVCGEDVFVRACAGVAQVGGGADATGADLLRRADIAMRHARATGREVETYVAEVDAANAAQLSLAADLRTGIAQGELVLHAQPQIRLADGAVTGMEMLVRWDHPTLGLLQPGAFLPCAEQNGLEGPLTAWVLEAAVQALARWSESGVEVTASVNVPASSLTSHDLCRLTERLLRTHRVPGERLVVEITESGLLTNISQATEVLHGIAALGVKVSIDDFGTGFSSMSRLRHLPVDEIKIDRSFVATMLQDRDDEAIVRSIIELARSLGLVCVAEGIDDVAVYGALQRFGCELGQGFLMSRPMPVEDVVAWVTTSPREAARRGILGRDRPGGRPAAAHRGTRPAEDPPAAGLFEARVG